MSDSISNRAREIYLELHSIDASAMEIELDRLVAGDKRLRQAVVSLLDARAGADLAGLMSSPTSGTIAMNARITEAAGSVIGPYKLLQLIGEGGFGSVFLAEQSRPVRRRVALKIIKLGMDTKQVIARFEAERQALAMMDHPNIAKVYDAGATESGRPYFSMEYVVGDTITKFADAHKLDIPSRLVLFAQACSAVQHAHTKGIIHRDIKPANVLVSMVDGKPFSKVIDFGIAKATASPLTDKTLFTEHRQLIGTPEYMSPEQAEGSPDIDTRTDVYALGVLLYELLTGQTPFDAKRLRSAAYAEMQRIIKEEDPPAPSLKLTRNLKSLAQTAMSRQVEAAQLSTLVRGELDWIAMKALDKDRARRYETPSALAADVQRHLDGDAVIAAPVSHGYKLRKFVRKNRGMVIGGSVIAAALLVGMAGTLWGWRYAKEANDRTQQTLSYTQDRFGHFMLQRGWLDDTVTGSKHINIPDGDVGYRWQIIENEEEYSITFEPLEGQGEDELTRGLLADFFDIAEEKFNESSKMEFEARVGIIKMLKLLSDAGNDGDMVNLLNTQSGVSEFNKDPIPISFRWGIQLAESLKEERDQLKIQIDAAEWNSYTANLALAQMAMDNGNWPEARERIADCPESKRGWEWEYLNRLASGIVFNGYPSPFMAQFMPDGQSVLMGSYTNMPTVLDVNTGKEIQDLPGLETAVQHARFSNDGKYLSAWGLQESRVAIWRVDQAGKYILHRTIEWEGGNAYDAHFDPTGERVIIPTRNSGENVLLWDIDSNQQIAAFEASAIWAAFSLDGRYIVSPRDDGVCIFDASGTTTEPLVVLLGEKCNATNDVFSKDGSMLVTISKNNLATVWDLHPDRLGSKITVLSGHTDILRSAVFNPDGTMIVTVSHDRAGKLWDTSADNIGDLLATLRGHGKWAASVDFSADGRLIAIGSGDGVLRVWDSDRTSATFGSQLWSEHLGGYVDEVGFNSATSEGEVLLMADGLTFDDYGERTLGSGLSVFKLSEMGGDGPNFVSNRYDTVQLQLDAIFGERIITIPEYRVYVSLEPQNGQLEVMTADGSRQIVADSDQTIQFYDSSTQKLVTTIRTERNIIDMAMTSDGSRLVLLEFEPGRGLYLEVLDIRNPEDRRADVQQRWAERAPAGEYLDELMAGATPTNDLMSIIEEASSLTPLRRLAAAELLLERLSDIFARSNREFAVISKDQTDKAAVLAAAQAADLPARVKEQVLAKAEAWEYTPPKVTEAAEKQRLAEAGTIVNLFLHYELPHLGDDRPKLVEAVEARIALFGEDHPESMVASWVLGVIDFYEGRRDIGLERMRATAKLYGQWTPPDYEDYLLIAMYDNLIHAELITDHTEEAEVWLGKLIQTLEGLVEDDPEHRWSVIPRGYAASSVGFLPRVLEFDYRRNIELPGNRKARDESTEDYYSRIGRESPKEYLSRVVAGFREVQRTGLRETTLRQNSQQYSLLRRTINGAKSLQVVYRWGGSRAQSQSVVEAFPNDQRSQRPFALRSYRDEQYETSLTAITLAAQYRAAMPDDPTTAMDESAAHPFDSAILAMSHFQLAQPLPESDPARVEHLVAAHDALSQCQAIMADPKALNPDGKPWSDDPISQSLLAEAEALIQR